jgi:hypothetical protein
MAFTVNYNAGGVIDEVKKIKAILGGVLDEVKQVDNILGGVIDEVKVVDLIKKIELLEKVGLIDRLETLGNIEGGTIDEVKVVDEVKKILGGVIDEVKLVDSVTTVSEVSTIKSGTLDEVKVIDTVNHIRGMAEFTQPFNEMVKLDIPAMTGMYSATYTTPNEPVEIVCLTVTCSGYGEADYYNLYCNSNLWFKNWYCSEVREGLYLGSNTTVYRAAPNSELKLEFNNDSGTSKVLWFGIRMLKQ